MKKIIAILLLCSSIAMAAKKQVYQCAVDQVVPNGVRLNVNETNGKIRGNLIFGTTISGTSYNLVDNGQGYDGVIRSKPDFTLELIITKKKAKNSNVDGYKSHLRATYPTVLNSQGYKVVDTDLICGKKIASSWN